MRYLLVFILLAVASFAQAAAPRQCPLPPQAPPVDPAACICGDSCTCPAGKCPSGCPLALPEPPAAPPSPCANGSCRLAPSAPAVGLAQIAALGQFAEFRSGSGRCGLFCRIKNRIQQRFGR